MQRHIKRIIWIICVLAAPLVAWSQTLWPGDVNNNGIVNGVDVLYIGLAYNASGPERSDDETDWEPTPIDALWDQSFPDGINYAYADCNGDGIIDGDDIRVIEENYGLTHGEQGADGFANGLPGIDPPLSLTPSTDKAEPGNQVNIGLGLGSPELPANDFYGLAFQFTYDPDLIDNEDDDDEEDEEIELEELEESWITRFQDDDLEVFLMTDPTTGRGEVAITRTNQQSVPMGDGPIGLFTIVIEDIVVGLEQPRPLEFRIDRVRLIDTTLQTTAIAPDTTTILIAPDTSMITTSSDDLRPPEYPVQLFPNPTRGDILFTTPGKVRDVQLFNLTGQAIPVRWYPGATHRVVPHRIQTGVYVLHILMNNQLETKTVTIISQ